MNKLVPSFCASALAATFAVTSAGAVPMVMPNMQSLPTNVQKAQGEWWMGGSRNRGAMMPGAWRGGGWQGRGWQGRGWDRGWHRGARWNGGWGGRGYYNGYRGYRYYRPGYRYYNDFWFPGAAFATGAIIGGIIANSQPAYRYSGGSAHERWCYNRYRSYRAWDNTFQPYNGPRRQCYSPY